MILRVPKNPPSRSQPGTVSGAENNSHSEEECIAALLEQTNKKVFSTRDSKKGKCSSTGKTFRAFKQDLDHVVMRGEHGGELDYILEMSNRDDVCAWYLLFTYGKYDPAKPRDVQVSGGKEVVDLWRRNSRLGLSEDKAEELLLDVHGRL